MATGIMKSIQNDRGFGFIKRDGGMPGAGDRPLCRSVSQAASCGDMGEGQGVRFMEERDPRVPTRFRSVAGRPVSESSRRIKTPNSIGRGPTILIASRLGAFPDVVQPARHSYP